MNKMGLYWWGHGRIWFMPMEKKEVITEEMAKRFFAEVEKRTGKSIRRTRDALEWVEVREYTFANGARILAFFNDTMMDTTDICDDPYAAGLNGCAKKIRRRNESSFYYLRVKLRCVWWGGFAAISFSLPVFYNNLT